MLICSVHCISALLRCPASASALGAGLASCRPLRQKLLPEHQAPTLFVRSTGSAPSCGAQRLLRPLGGPRILLTAAPKLLPEHQAPTLSVPGNCINALLRCPASASTLGRVSRLADRCAKNCSLNIKLQRFLFRATASMPSCGALHPLRPLGGSRVLQTAAPKIAPCFRRRRRSQF